MPGQASSVGSKIMLDAASGRATQSSRTTYLVLLTAAPSDSTTLASMSEVSTAGYARQSVTWTDPTTTETTSNSAAITFGPFSADPPNVTHCAVVSAASGTSGDFIWYFTLDNARDASTGDSISVAVGALSMSAE
jgi:hypothetical protein